jgi:hypothetical protein
VTYYADRARGVSRGPLPFRDAEHDSPYLRVALLTEHLGDPEDPDNPVGFARLLAADQRGDTSDALLAGLDLDAELVPRLLGGRLVTLERLVRVGRSVVRRGPGLSRGWLTGSVLGAASVWLAGDDRQRCQVAGLLLAGGRLACGFGEDDLADRPTPHPVTLLAGNDSVVLSGTTEPIVAVDSADAVVLVAQAGSRPTLWSRTPLLLSRADLTAARVRIRSVDTVSWRRPGAVDFADARITDDTVLRGAGDVGGLDSFGGFGASVQALRRALAFNRILVTAMLTAAVDTALGIAASEATRLGRPPDIVAAALVDVFIALSAAETLTDVVVRSAHVYPGESGLHAAAVGYGVTGLLTECMDRLADIVSEHGHADSTAVAFFWKLRRDVAAIIDEHIDRMGCRRALLAQLPSVARRGWHAPTPAAVALFLQDSELPMLDLGGLTVTGNGNDHLVSCLPAALADLAAATAPSAAARVADKAEPLAAELVALRAECERLPSPDLGDADTSDAIRLADSYVRVLIGSTCLETWRHNLGHDRRGDTADLSTAILDRLSGRGGTNKSRTDRLFADVLRHAAITTEPQVPPLAACPPPSPRSESMAEMVATWSRWRRGEP